MSADCASTLTVPASESSDMDRRMDRRRATRISVSYAGSFVHGHALPAIHEQELQLAPHDALLGRRRLTSLWRTRHRRTRFPASAVDDHPDARIVREAHEETLGKDRLVVGHHDEPAL